MMRDAAGGGLRKSKIKPFQVNERIPRRALA
jgi:hypothetical protein